MEEERTVLCVANQKGGCGKTTIAYHLARLAAQASKSVLAVDMDPQGNLTELFTEGELKTENHTRGIFDEKSPTPLTVTDGIRLIGSDITLSAYEKRASWHDIGLLRLYLADRPERLIIVDCPPNLGLMTSSALFCATRLLVPVTMGRSSVKGLRDLFATAKDLRDMGKDVQVEQLRQLDVCVLTRSLF
jgi:chromosome partitioning protein